MKHQRHVILFALIVILLFAVPAASAHRPAEAEPAGITEIPSATTSFAFYEVIETADQVDVYTFDGAADSSFHAGINIPQIAGLEDYGVNLALLGPGLPALNPASLPELSAFAAGADQSLAAAIAAGELGGIVRASQDTESFYEPFTQTNYWGRQSLDITLRQSGRHYLVVWQPAGLAGKYVMDTGTEEVFGPADLFRFPIWWLNVRLYFEQTTTVTAAMAIFSLTLLLVATGVTRLVVSGYRRRKDPFLATR